jgi:hypothetical protein
MSLTAGTARRIHAGSAQEDRNEPVGAANADDNRLEEEL